MQIGGAVGDGRRNSEDSCRITIGTQVETAELNQETQPNESERTGCCNRLAALISHRAAGWMLLTYWVALTIGTHVPLPPGVLPGNSDKAAHFMAYAGLATLLYLWLRTGSCAPRRAAGIGLAAVVVWGAMDELLQIPAGRHCDIRDWMADSFGAALAIATALSADEFLRARLSRPVQSERATTE